MAGLSSGLYAAPAAAPAGSPATNAAASHAPSTNSASALPPPEALARYGKILAPSNEAAHPVKLKLPFPDVGEIKIPNEDELVMREKLEQLAELSDADIHTKLEKWPVYAKMNLRDQGALLQRIQDFRDFHSNMAKAKAREMGLPNLTPDQQVQFEKEYWSRRLQIDRDLAKQFEPVFQASQQKLKDDLVHQYNTVMGPMPLAQGAKPAAPPAPAPANKPAPTPAAKIPPTAAVVEMTNTMQPSSPIAQGPR